MNVHAFKITPLLLASALALSLSACQSRPPVPEPRYIPNVALKDSVELEVLPYRGVCDSATPMQCLLVKPVGASDEAIFGIGYNDIIGFEHHIGTHYHISVREQIDQNTGNATGRWQLDEILLQNIR